QLAGVRTDRGDRLLVAVERDRVEPLVGQPALGLDEISQRCRILTQSRRLTLVTSPRAELRHCQSRRVQIALQLDRRDRQLGAVAVRIDDGVDGILPTLVVVATVASRRVLLETVAVAITVFVAPSQRTLRR